MVSGETCDTNLTESHAIFQDGISDAKSCYVSLSKNNAGK